ncbi:UNVERIFIED_ORG: hypothetical protein FHR35_002723 [Microbispora rosea subsp. rosea]
MAQLLAGLADSRLYMICLQGTAGVKAAQVTKSAARDLLRAVTQGMNGAHIYVHSQFELTATGGYELSGADRALLAAVGALVRYGYFLEEVIALLDATDEVCRRSTEARASDEQQKLPLSTIVSAALIGINSGNQKIAAAIILEACRVGRSDQIFPAAGGSISIDGFSVLLRDANCLSFGRLLLLCYLLQATDDYDLASLGPRLLQLTWESQVYHVQLEGLQAVQMLARRVEGSAVNAQIVDTLETMHTDDVMISSQLIETLFAYGLIDSPGDVAYIQEQIADILQGVGTAEECQLAYGIVTSVFEDVIAPPYIEAIEALDSEQRMLLYVKAAIGAPSDGFWVDWLLKQLIEFSDRRALPAYERWGKQIDVDTPFVQQPFACYSMAMKGCALFLEEPPSLSECRTSEKLAWQYYGAIIFWMQRCKTDAEAISQCAPYWKKLRAIIHAAVDPICWLSDPSVMDIPDGEPVIWRMARIFSSEVRHILEWGLQNQASITAAARTAHWDGANRIVYILSGVGNSETVELLRQYVDDPSLGRSAVDAIRRLTSA